MRRVGSIWDPKGIAAVLDTSTLVSARLARRGYRSVAREIYRLAGIAYDSFTSPAILKEVEEVLVRPRFSITREDTRRWIDAFIRSSRQVDSDQIPGDYRRALGNDADDNDILKTALAVSLHDEGREAIAYARGAYGCFVVSFDQHFQPGFNVSGWEFIHRADFHGLLRRLE